MFELLKSIEDERDFLIKEMAHNFDNDELFRLSGRIYELTRLKNRIEGMVNTDGE